MILDREKIKRMVGNGGSGGNGAGLSISQLTAMLAGYATEAWTEDNYVSKSFFNHLFIIHGTRTTVVTDSSGDEVSNDSADYTFGLNELPKETSTTDADTGEVTTVTTAITDVEVRFGLWSDGFVSALGKGSGGSSGGSGASLLADLLDVEVGAAKDGQTLTYNRATGKWVNADSVAAAVAWNDITGKPSSYTPSAHHHDSRYYISGGTIYLGDNSITPISQDGLRSLTWWGQAFSSGATSITGNMTNVGNITGIGGLIKDFQSIELNSGTAAASAHGGYIDFHYAGTSNDYSSRIIESGAGKLSIEAMSTAGAAMAAALSVGAGQDASSIQIGNIMIVYDEANDALKIIQSDGTAAHLYATGGISALGMQAGVDSISAMTFGNLKVTDAIVLSAGKRIAQESGVLHLGTSDNTGSIKTQDIESQANDDTNHYWSITQNGYGRFRRLYLDDSRYLYMDGNTLKFYDGSTSKTVSLT